MCSHRFRLTAIVVLAMALSASIGPAAADDVDSIVGEDRTIEARNGGFIDDFGPHAVHIYRVKR